MTKEELLEQQLIHFPKIDSTIINLRSKNKIPDYGGVYAFYSKEGYLIYIGKTASFKQRMNYHLSDGYKKLISRMEVFRLDNEIDREIYETYLINKWKPLFNIKKTFSYSPLSKMLKEFDPFESVEEIINCYSDGYNFDFIRKIDSNNEHLGVKEVCNAIDEILTEPMIKSDVRNKLSDYGYNVNEIMKKAEFDEMLKENGFLVTTRYVRKRDAVLS